MPREQSSMHTKASGLGDEDDAAIVEPQVQVSCEFTGVHGEREESLEQLYRVAVRVQVHFPCQLHALLFVALRMPLLLA